MELFEALEGRRSIRKFTGQALPDGALDRILEAGRAAPSAGNLQARDFFVVMDAATREKLAGAAHGQEFVAQAPAVIVICANLERIKPYGQRGTGLYCLQDSAASCQNMLLAAHALGLGTCWVGAFDEDAVSRILDLPGHLRPVAMVPVGHPAQEPKPRPKRDDDIHMVG